MLPLPIVVQALVLCAAAAGAPASTFTGRPFPPPGTPQDQALLGSMLTTHAALLDGRMLAIRLMKRLHEDDVMGRLARQEAPAGPDAAARRRDLRERLQRAWDADRELVSRPWPVDPRIGCRAEGIELEVVMADAEKPGRAQAAREAAQKCLARQVSVQKPLEAANRTLLAADAEARAALARTSPPTPATAAQAAPAAGAPEGARGRCDPRRWRPAPSSPWAWAQRPSFSW